MTKYDIKLRRKSLTYGQIEKHKDFKGLAGKFGAMRKAFVWIKLLVVLFALSSLILMAIFGHQHLSKKKPPIENHDMEIFEEFKTE